jgi:hypothetical protein
MRHLLTVVAFVLVAALLGPPAGAVDCPSEYSTCTDQPGKSCRLDTGSQCSIVDLGVQSCTRPGQSAFSCQQGQTVGKKNCSCHTRLQSECCTEGDCEFGECGSCEIQAGSQSLLCLGIACAYDCTQSPSYCTGEGTGCWWSGTCGGGGCCSYTCGSMPSCHGVDPCPEHACTC